MYTYHIETLAQNYEDLASAHKSITLNFKNEPTEEDLFFVVEEHLQIRGYVLLEILDYYLVDAE